MRIDDRVTRWYFRTDRLTDAAFRAVHGCLDGLWLGLLGPERLARIDQVYYDRELMYVTESYNRRGLWAWEQAVIDRHFGAVRRIAVTSAGGGREVLALARAGFDVTGYEPHADLARFGAGLLRREGVDATIEACARDVWPARTSTFDAAVVGWGGYMLITGRSRRVAFLRDATRCLPPAAPVLVSFFPSSGRDLRFRVTARVANALRHALRREPVDLGDVLAPNLVHFFTRDEVAAELAEAGLDMIDHGADEYGWAVGRVRGPAGERGAHVEREHAAEAARRRGGVAAGRG